MKRELVEQLRDALNNANDNRHAVEMGADPRSYDAELIAAAEAALAEPVPPAQVFGIIDPDYARVFTHARIAAWQYGYACLAHGSFTRDLDLLLVPWQERATQEIDAVVALIADRAGLKLQGAPSDKPHGRRAWTLLFPQFGDRRWVDVSAFVPAPPTDTATGKDAK